MALADAGKQCTAKLYGVAGRATALHLAILHQGLRTAGHLPTGISKETLEVTKLASTVIARSVMTKQKLGTLLRLLEHKDTVKSNHQYTGFKCYLQYRYD